MLEHLIGHSKFKMLNQEEIHQQILKQQLHFAWHMNNPVTKKYLRLDEFINTIM